MRPFTQREMLSEGFWDNFKRVVKGAAYVGKHVLPKTAAGINKVKEYGQGLATAVSSKEALVKKELERQGYTMVPGTLKQHEGGKNFIVFAKPVSEADEKTKPVLDANGQPVLDPKTGEPQTEPVLDTKGNPEYNIKAGKAKPFIVDEKNNVKEITGSKQNQGQQRGNQGQGGQQGNQGNQGNQGGNPPQQNQGGTPPPLPTQQGGTPPPLPQQGGQGNPPPLPQTNPPTQQGGTPPTQAPAPISTPNAAPPRTPVPKKKVPKSRP